MADGPEINWPALRSVASEAAANAHAPYSRLHVGAAGITEHGAVVSGCNVENESFGLTLCAECGLVSALRRSGEDTLVAVAVVDGDGRTLTPCGRCRQILLEHGGPELLIDSRPAPRRLGELLPDAFELEDLE